jgi:hypothetical protein
MYSVLPFLHLALANIVESQLGYSHSHSIATVDCHDAQNDCSLRQVAQDYLRWQLFS